MKRGVRMQRAVRAFITASVASAALLAGVAASASAGTLDQQQTSFNFDGAITGDPTPQSLAQTFTAGITGRLDQADLMLDKFFSPVDPVTIEIRDVVGGLPGGATLASTSIPSSAILDNNPAFVSATFASPATVTAGTQYALVAWTTDTTGNYGWSVQLNTDPYPGGRGVNSQASPPVFWEGPPGDDFAFKTYVVPSPAAQPVPHKKKCKKRKKKHKSGAEIAKKKKCKKKHRH